ncbi:MAG: flagellar protein FlaG [Proteobacteria bacterium]|nr:flagellar protein FlaG [Pseudomonadota bacterium]MBU1715782.1 flagellar protein FlaG [Pseudomonadota bacterium]
MDINTNAEVKGFGVVPAPSVVREERIKPQVAPVQNMDDSAKVALDEKALHGSKVQGSKPKSNGEKGAASAEDIARYVGEIQERLQSMGSRLSLALDKDSNSIVVQVTDRETGELIRQIPSEQMMELKSKLEDLVGMLLDQKV